MRLHAYINNNIIEKIETISESKWIDDIKSNEAIIDIEDTIPQPEVGWVLNNSLNFVPAQPLSQEKALAIQQKSQRLFGAKLAEELTDRVGTQNLILSTNGSNVDVTSLLQSLGNIKLLLETGALKTARGIVSSISPMFPLYSNVLSFCIEEISEFLQKNSWE